MGLVHVLENLAQPEELGHLIAAAFIATLWGVLSANVIWLPIGSRLKRLGELEAARMELVIEGVLAIQAGSNPRIIAQKLHSLLPAGEQEAERRRRPDMSAAAQAARGARGAREPRAVAGHLRRHGDAADGALHRACSR